MRYPGGDEYDTVFAFMGVCMQGMNAAGLVLTFYNEQYRGVTSYPLELSGHAELEEITLNKLSGKGFFLKHEIKIAIDKEINGYIISNKELNVIMFLEKQLIVLNWNGRMFSLIFICPTVILQKISSR